MSVIILVPILSPFMPYKPAGGYKLRSKNVFTRYRCMQLHCREFFNFLVIKNKIKYRKKTCLTCTLVCFHTFESSTIFLIYNTCLFEDIFINKKLIIMTSFLSDFWIDISCSLFLYYSCRNLPSQPIIFRGHSDGISSFSIWGQDVISISRNRIGLLSLSKSAIETVCFSFFRLTPT